jgi:hypothetical protein
MHGGFSKSWQGGAKPDHDTGKNACAMPEDLKADRYQTIASARNAAMAAAS